MELLGKLEELGIGELGNETGCSKANAPCEVRCMRLPEVRPQLEDWPWLEPPPFSVDLEGMEEENDTTEVSPV